MDPTGIPKEVRDFIIRHIHSVGHLEALLLIYGRQGECLSAATVCAELRDTLQATSERLADLHAHGLLEAKSGSETAYGPVADPDLRAVIDSLAQAYNERRVTVIELIFSKPLKHIQVFADAFRLRQPRKGEPGDG